MQPKSACGKVIGITLAMVAGACTVALVIHRLLRDLIDYCATYQTPTQSPTLAFDEIEEDPLREGVDTAYQADTD